jgi:hypothetical protein
MVKSLYLFTKVSHKNMPRIQGKRREFISRKILTLVYQWQWLSQKYANESTELDLDVNTNRMGAVGSQNKLLCSRG